MPWDLHALVLAALYQWRGDQRSQGQRPAPREVEAERARLEQSAVERWRDRLAVSRAGRRTCQALLPVLEEWMRRGHGRLSYRLTQVLTGHGCFGAYLAQIGRELTGRCHHCDGREEDTAQHTLESCPAWAREREDLIAVVGGDLSLAAVVARMAGSREAFVAVQTFCESVLLQKEEAERVREASADAPMIRRRRTGRWRGRFALLLPPP
ncbi:hypothetical protein ABMA28_000440 [Loxostege sticticalis]